MKDRTGKKLCCKACFVSLKNELTLQSINDNVEPDFC